MLSSLMPRRFMTRHFRPRQRLSTPWALEPLESRQLLAVMAALDDPVPAGPPAEPDSYVIISQTESLPEQLTEQVAEAGGTITGAFPELGIAVASSGQGKFADRVASLAGIEAVVPNVSVFQVDPSFKTLELPEPTDSPNTDDDEWFPLQWSLDAVNAQEAWSLGARGTGTRVAVLDTGIDTDHPDLKPNLNLELSRSFVEGEPLEFNPAIGGYFSHGTHVDGIIAAADNGLGTIGVAPEAELVHVKVLSDNGTGDLGSIVAGIVYAADIDADVINLSVGSSFTSRGYALYDLSNPADDVYLGAQNVSEMRRAMDRAVAYAERSGATVVAAAGNMATDRDHSADMIITPADSPGVLTVAATGPHGWALDQSTNLDLVSPYTNYGRSAIDFAAPGGGVRDPEMTTICSIAGSPFLPCWAFDYVLSTNAGDDWTLASGTSMAAPHVAGVAALVIGLHGGDLDPTHVERLLRGSADDLDTNGKDPYFGFGRIDALEAVMASLGVGGPVDPPAPPPRPEFSMRPAEDGDAINWSSSDDEPAEPVARVPSDLLEAGDANADGMFDQLDIVQVLQSGKYMTGRLAAWGEGDWYADGVFDQLDIVAALATGNFLNGPYATLDELVDPLLQSGA